jgi:hypothetical protein
MSRGRRYAVAGTFCLLLMICSTFTTAADVELNPAEGAATPAEPPVPLVLDAGEEPGDKGVSDGLTVPDRSAAQVAPPVGDAAPLTTERDTPPPYPDTGLPEYAAPAPVPSMPETMPADTATSAMTAADYYWCPECQAWHTGAGDHVPIGVPYDMTSYSNDFAAWSLWSSLAAGAEAWDGGLDFGLNGSSGNAENLNVYFGLDAAREWGVGKLSVDLDTFYANNGGAVTDNSVFLLGRYEAPLADERFGWFFDGWYEYDQFRGFDYRIGFHTGLTAVLMNDGVNELNGLSERVLKFDVGWVVPAKAGFTHLGWAVVQLEIPHFRQFWWVNLAAEASRTTHPTVPRQFQNTFCSECDSGGPSRAQVTVDFLAGLVSVVP